jgi:hypothetical protein
VIKASFEKMGGVVVDDDDCDFWFVLLHLIELFAGRFAAKL